MYMIYEFHYSGSDNLVAKQEAWYLFAFHSNFVVKIFLPTLDVVK